jgi:hypothetical protein
VAAGAGEINRIREDATGGFGPATTVFLAISSIFSLLLAISARSGGEVRAPRRIWW